MIHYSVDYGEWKKSGLEDVQVLIEQIADEYSCQDSDSGWELPIHVRKDGENHYALAYYESGYMGGGLESVITGSKEEIESELRYKPRWNTFYPERDWILL